MLLILKKPSFCQKNSVSIFKRVVVRGGYISPLDSTSFALDTMSWLSSPRYADFSVLGFTPIWESAGRIETYGLLSNAINVINPTEEEGTI